MANLDVALRVVLDGDAYLLDLVGHHANLLRGQAAKGHGHVGPGAEIVGASQKQDEERGTENGHRFLSAVCRFPPGF